MVRELKPKKSGFFSDYITKTLAYYYYLWYNTANDGCGLSDGDLIKPE